MQLKKLKAMTDYLAENYPELLEDYVSASCDRIFLPSPKDQTDVGLHDAANENDFYIQSNGSLRGYC